MTSPDRAVARPMRSARDSSPPLPAGGATVLVVDGDAVTRRFVELALAPESRLQVETVTTAAAALDLLRITPCDLVVTEARLPDLDGLDLVRRLRGRGVHHELSIVVLTADDRVERKVAAFAAGADDYLCKPCAVDELRARVVRRLRRRQVDRAERQGPAAVLAGQLAAMPLPDLVGVLAMGGKAATLEVHTPRGPGRLYFADGRVVHATYLSVTGARAFYHLFAEERGDFQLFDGCDAREHTIHESVTGLIMEAARRLDTARAEGGTGAAPTPVVGAPGPGPLPISVRRLAPERDLALGFTRDITDVYNHGSLELVPVAGLSAWLHRPARGPRLQAALVAPAMTGAAALASICTAPGERELAAAVSGEPRCLVATIRGRDHRELDLVLVPLGADATVAALGRRPDLLVLGGPEGELVGQWRSYPEALARLGATVVVTVGAESFSAAVASELMGSSALSCHRAADLADPGELRRSVVEGIRLWLSGAR